MESEIGWQRPLSACGCQGAKQAQDTCLLSTEELDLRTELKFKCLGLASLAHTIARQRLWILHLKEGDSNTRYFQPQAWCTLVDEEDKVEVIL
jgi:hypothetical protein